MPESEGKLDRTTLLKNALFEIRNLREALQKSEMARAEPLAVIGMSCRFPGGGNHPEAFWELLREGRDAIGQIPATRWDVDSYYDPDPDVPGKMYTREGGFLDVNVQDFDAEFFNIAPREAVMMDPQQRLLLEVCWEALENAGLTPAKLQGSRTGVFMGLSTSDYSRLGGDSRLSLLNPYSATGNSASIATGRLSYVLGLQGPNLAVDTACSSSLVAVHLAVQALRQHECDLALVGGVNLMLSPESTICFCKLRALSVSGRCRAFDESADGYVRGEGCGVVLLKRLSDAQAHGDRVLAMIRGSAVNHDGRSNGLTAPNQAAQVKVITEALAAAGVSPDDVSYLEAHGTGTSLGDPIEVGALARVFSSARPAPMVVGSVKTNIGHLEAAAGVAGLIKVILALEHHEIPAHLHLKRINPMIESEQVRIHFPSAQIPWESPGKHRISGISSFGFSGTNAHVVVEESPLPEERASGVDRPLHLLALSARNKSALSELARRIEIHATQYRDSLEDTCFTANTCRTHFEHRFATVAGSKDELIGKLAEFARDEKSSRILQGRASEEEPEVAFLFTGQGSQYGGMGRELYETQPRFRGVLERSEEILRRHLEKPLLRVMYGEKEGEEGELNQTQYTQPALFALQWGLWELWRSWGVEAGGVLGHSVGEYAAAAAAGVFSWEEGLVLMARRGAMMQSLPRGGGMAVLYGGEEQVRGVLEGMGGAAVVAAVNGPENVVIGGRGEAVEEVLGKWEGKGERGQKLKVEQGFHSPLMEPILEKMEAAAAEVKYGRPKVEMISNVSGEVVGEEVMEAGYWRRQVREPVRFWAGMKKLEERGYRVFVELGPDPVLVGMGRRCVKEGKVWLPSLRQGRSDWRQMLESVGGLYVAGVEVDWTGLDRDYARKKVALPNYPFQRQRYWAPAEPGAGAGGEKGEGHPLLGARVGLAGTGEIRYQNRLSTERLPYLADHKVYGRVVLPGSALVEMAVAAAANALGPPPWSLENLRVLRACLIPEHPPRDLLTRLEAERGGWHSFKVFDTENAEQDAGGAATSSGLYASGSVTARSSSERPAPISIGEIRSRFRTEMPINSFYQGLSKTGLQYGAAFRPIDRVWRDSAEALGSIRLPQDLTSTHEKYYLHPVLLDGCFQLVAAAASGIIHTDDAYIPFAIDKLEVFAHPGTAIWGLVTVGPIEEGVAEMLTADLTLFDEHGVVLSTVNGLALKRVSQEQLKQAQSVISSGELHPLLGVKLKTIADRPDHHYWEISLGSEKLPYAAVYKLRDGVLLQMAAFAEMAQAFAREVFPAKTCSVSPVHLHGSLLIQKGTRLLVQTRLALEDQSKGNFRVYSRPFGDQNRDRPWDLHASALIRS